jgi:FKBP-type peptidyl-prolyl cis-trans isomerase FklB
MRSIVLATVLAALLTVPAAAQSKPVKKAAPAQPTGNLKTLRDKASYAIGLKLGEQFARQLVDPNIDAMLAGVEDGMAGKKQLTDEQLEAVMQAFDKEIGGKLAERNLREGKAYLAANKKKPGVKVTKSGLQYKILKEGKPGPKPGPDDTITAHYRGTLINGQEFDSSFRRGAPIQIPMESLIAGWKEALLMMTPGAKWQLVVPTDLAYGESGHPPIIEPNCTLIFEMELIGSQKAEAVSSDVQPRRRPAARAAARPEEETR